jgi:hypothetical protein
MNYSRRRPLTTVVAAAAVVPLLCACVSGSTSVETDDSGRMIAVSGNPNPGGAEQALAEGPLTFADSGCLVIEMDGEQYLVVFPYGARLTNEAVLLEDGHRLGIGDAVGLGGGFHTVEEGDDYGQVPVGCVTDEVFWASGELAD